MKAVVWILAISLIFNLAGLFFAYKYLKTKRRVAWVTQNFIQARNDYNRRFDTHMLFIHHSVGHNWLTEGNLKDSLESLGMGVHSATYGSDVGQETDMSDWVPKFDRYSEKMLKYDIAPDILYPGDRKNGIIMFKPCFPNSDVISEGKPPGDPLSGELTVWNYKAVIEKLGERFSKSPKELYIYVTAPPLVPSQTTEDNAGRAREFNNWVKKEFVDEYNERTGFSNLLVFDLFDVLADSTNCLRSEFRRSEDNSHPNAAGSLEATDHFMRFWRENNISTNGK